MAEFAAGRESFLIQVLDRQNATWQGTVTWTEGKREQPFRSALELLKLMDSVLEDEKKKGPRRPQGRRENKAQST